MKYRRIPSIVEANQWEGPGHQCPGVYPAVLASQDSYITYTSNGPVPIRPGDFAVFEPVQDRPGVILAYPCSRDVFLASHSAHVGFKNETQGTWLDSVIANGDGSNEPLGIFNSFNVPKVSEEAMKPVEPRMIHRDFDDLFPIPK